MRVIFFWVVSTDRLGTTPFSALWSAGNLYVSLNTFVLVPDFNSELVSQVNMVNLLC